MMLDAVVCFLPCVFVELPSLLSYCQVHRVWQFLIMMLPAFCRLTVRSPTFPPLLSDAIVYARGQP